MITLANSPANRMNACLEYTDGLPAQAMVERKLGATSVRTMPVEALDSPVLDGDVLVVCRTGSAAAAVVNRHFGVRAAGIRPSGYRIQEVKDGKRKAVIILGGDLFGMLAGLADVLVWSERTSRGLVYRGGTRTENAAFPLRFFWTWDHSTNWVLDDEGNQVNGCANQYLKQPETYLEDYRRLIDHCLEARFNGVIIWGFLRDAHGGERYAHDIARYAADRGVAILPGVGTTGYGGIYYEGEHPYNLETYLARNPKRGNRWKDGQYSARELSPYDPANQQWIAESLAWLYRSFPIGGVNLENSDLMVDHSNAGKRGRAGIRSGEADYFKDQFFAYKTALDIAHKVAPDAWNTYATYSGFGRGREVTNAGADMGCEPYFARRMPPSAMAQWTLTGMLSETPLKLRDWMTKSRPSALYRNPRWPKGLMPPTPRSAGFIHQASQWNGTLRRSALAVSTFAEGCLRSHEAGLEGISIHGEVTNRTLAWKLNYLAMRHWTYHPVSTLEAFADSELSPRVGGARDAQDFADALCKLEEGKDRRIEAGKRASEAVRSFYPYNGPARGDLAVTRQWAELQEWAHIPEHSKSPVQGFADIL
ncbi:MAG: hypothetical protein A2498_07110 [Lentisphaerae bacterium RIFOXYC12_FULL_60_16]|nr:MAG: hypothetical protein A2498_07110 [Lentisphaerae bacterium RIFOXYC12_FULL_60_16]